MSSIGKSVTILSFDPGTKMGWSYLVANHDGKKWNIVVKEWGTLDGDKLSRTRKQLYSSFSRLFVRSEAFYFAFIELLVKYVPTYVVSEGAFVQKFPAIFASLVTTIHTLRRACRDIATKDLIEIAPMVSKKIITGKANADKVLMEKGLLARTDISFEKKINAGDLGEHEIDAICHGCAFLLSGMNDGAPVFSYGNDGTHNLIQQLIRHIVDNAEYIKTLEQEKE